jgi:hypothetical protein
MPTAAGQHESEAEGGRGDETAERRHVVGTGVDPVTSRFSGARSTN